MIDFTNMPARKKTYAGAACKDFIRPGIVLQDFAKTALDADSLKKAPANIMTDASKKSL